MIRNIKTLLVLVIVFCGFAIGVPSVANADPTLICHPSSARVHFDAGGDYCKCKKGQLLLYAKTTDRDQTCKTLSSCPKGYAADKLDASSGNQKVCVPKELTDLYAKVNASPTNTHDPSGDSSDGTAITVNKAPAGANVCGDPTSDEYVNTSIDLGCKGKGNPIIDMLFALIRFLSYGVGLVIVASLVYAGIQYTGSRGDPNANAMAVKRIQSNVTALLIFVFAYAILNYIIPGAVLK